MRLRFRRQPAPAPTASPIANEPNPPMRVERIALDRLTRIARDSEAHVAVDSVRRIAYLRRGQTRYEAPLPVDATT